MSDWTAADIPDQRGRVAVVTGASAGLGVETARELAVHGATVVMAVRNLEKASAVADAITATAPDARLELEQVDLASLESIGTAAQRLRERHPRIDLLVNNAGVMYTPRQRTVDGFELQFGTNHLGHFAWTNLLLDRLLAVDGSRVVTVSSLGHRFLSAIPFDDLAAERRYLRVAAYGRSKLANLLFTYELQRRLSAAGAPTAALAAHPGGSDTELARHVPGVDRVRPWAGRFIQTAAMGALATLRAATDPAAAGGEYYGPSGFLEIWGHPVVVRSSARSHDRALARRLWAVSEELTGVPSAV